MRVLAMYGLRAAAPPQRSPVTGIGFFIFEGIAIAIGAVAGALAGAAGALGLGSILTASVCTGLASTFVASATAALSKLLSDLVSLGINEIQKAINTGAAAIYGKVDEEIQKVKPEWDPQTRQRVAEPFVNAARQVMNYLAGSMGRQPGWSDLLPKWLKPGTIDKLSRFQTQIVTAVLLKDPTQAAFGFQAAMILAQHAQYGEESEFSAGWVKVLDTWNKSRGAPQDSGPAVEFAAPAAVTPEQAFADKAREIEAAGGSLLVNDGAMPDFTAALATIGDWTNSAGWEVADWSIAPWASRDLRLQLAEAVIRKLLAGNHLLQVVNVGSWAAQLVDTPEKGLGFAPARSMYGAAVNATLRKLSADRAAATELAKAQRLSSVLQQPAPTVTISASGAVTVSKPRPTVATFVWGMIFSR